MAKYQTGFYENLVYTCILNTNLLNLKSQIRPRH